jgi:HD-like signal output (HDOD) protein
VAGRLIETVSNPLSDAADVAAEVSKDVSLSAKILRIANSAYYGTPHEIASIQTAVVRLGFKVIHTMVLSLTVFDMFPAAKKASRFDRSAFWRHCVRCGIYSRCIAESGKLRGKVDSEEAFCAGLLHDIGKIVMEQYLHDDFCQALEYAHKQAKSYYEAESEVLGYTHTDVAEILISGWDLPDSLTGTIISHHMPFSGIVPQTEKQSAVCHLADWFCHGALSGIPDQGMQPPIDSRALDIAGIDEAAGIAIAARFEKQQEEMSAFFELLGG